MRNLKLLGGLALSLMAGFGQMIQPSVEFAPATKTKAMRTKPKQGGRNPLRGYYARYSHVLTPMMPEINGRNALNRNMLKRQRRAAA